MNHGHLHSSHPAIIARLKRANGHLKAAITMIETGRSCVQIAQQLLAVEKAIGNAKKTLIHDHIDHCLDNGIGHGHAIDHLDEFKEIAKYL